MKEGVTTIRILDTADWGCEYTQADLSAYEAEVVEEVSGAYPDAEVEIDTAVRGDVRILVCTRDETGRIDSSLESSAHEEAVESAVREIRKAVWNRGSFWIP